MAKYSVLCLATKHTMTVAARNARQALEKTFGKNLYESTFVDGFLTRFLGSDGSVRFDAMVIGKK